MKGFFLAIGMAVGAAVFAQTATIEVSNPAASERKDALVVLKRAWLKRKLPALNDHQYIIIKDKNTPQLVQFDDLDGDGVWDEAVLLSDLASRQKKKLSVTASAHPAAIKAVVRSYVRQKHRLPDNSFGGNVVRDTMPYNNLPTDFSKQKLPPYLTEGPAWENDKVGFRKYFDIRNANDIWGKRVPDMVLDEVGANPANSYHNLSAWGMDILKVGKSLGAGALALRVKVNGKDTLVRFGRNVGQLVYREVSNGPLRSVFELQYRNWQYLPGVAPITVTEQISIWGGQYFFENKVTFSSVPANASLVTGTIDFYSRQDHQISRQGIAGLYTYDRQSENKDQLGLAILTPAKNVIGFGHISSPGTDVTNVFTVDLKTSAEQPLVYRYYVGWELTDKTFASRQGFEKMLSAEVERFAKPVVIR
ncbi:DUF4861 domain-containing protein [Niabella drilacis]|uniref:DUF4861 domain-containing protein n=1 Tax=Niabella drilacis (strain DSM 25811 / CCM 8410 / CCUG 62505 / LMG 26954 / E90) TaxID=1285928 RepID=A0A1G6NQD6_NIADE|nr:DUF4861 domain-containing protein [Niabella drilacis]SDC69487.1 protein of unknown function [Niabella drilacis]